MIEEMVVGRLYPILEYKMNKKQAKAFKIALIWEDLTKQYFPGESCGKLPKKGDPRKSNLFRFCYKLIEERHGQLLNEQYRQFVKAQIDILRSIKTQDIHADVSPQCLVGDKSWRRWKVWLKKYRNLSVVQKTVDNKATKSKVLAKLDATKRFFIKTFGAEPTYEDIKKAFTSRAIIRWITLGRISAYYVILSPYVKRYLKNKEFEDVFEFDLGLYRDHITSDAESHFKKEFAYEF